MDEPKVEMYTNVGLCIAIIFIDYTPCVHFINGTSIQISTINTLKAHVFALLKDLHLDPSYASKTVSQSMK
jgi:hypothetical protein